MQIDSVHIFPTMFKKKPSILSDSLSNSLICTDLSGTRSLLGALHYVMLIASFQGGFIVSSVNLTLE